MKSAYRVSIAVVLGCVSSALGQWSMDSTDHQVVADGAGEQVQPKIVATSDGGAYVSWFSSVSGYDVRLQRLDAAGNEMWAHNGVLIADRGFSSTQDYGLDIDTSGHALIVFRDDRFGGVKITAQRVAPDGTFGWGPDGIQFANGADFVASPVIAGTSAGGSVVGWINENDSHLAGVDAAGVIGWTSVLSDPGGEVINVSDIHGSGAGSVIVSWVQRGTPFFAPKHLYAQKIDSTGAEGWASRVAVFDGGSLQFGNFPDFKPDGSGGAVFSWYDTAGALQVFAQHINADGTEQFSHNGAVVSFAPRERVSPEASYDSATDSVLVAWVELENNQGSQGVYAQRFDSLGVRQWTDGGIEISPPDANGSGSIRTEIMDGALVTMWIENAGGFGLDQVLAHAIAMDGSNVWAGGAVDVASDLAQRGRLATAMSNDGFVIAGWQIGDFGVADIQTHNINPDGTLGVVVCPADFTGEGDLDIFDILAFLDAFNSGDSSADFTGEGSFDIFDILAFLDAFNAGCP